MKKIAACLNIFLMIVITIIISGCRSYPPCISEQETGLLIIWGELKSETGEISGWSLDSKSILYSFVKTNSGDILRNKRSEIPFDKYCSLLTLTKQNILKTQALNAPGEVSRFVEFSNPASSVHLRALWNAKFETVGSKGFRQLYDSLQSIINSNK